MPDDAQAQRELRAAQNQALFREVNERLKGIAATFQFVAQTSSFACECADVSCVAQLQMTLDEYEALRADPAHFAVLPGHVFPDVEDVVKTGERFVIVAKQDAGADYAKHADPRSRDAGGSGLTA